MNFRTLAAGLVSTLLIAVFSTSAVMAQEGGRKIKLSGNVAEGIMPRVSIDEIEALGLTHVYSDNPYEDGAMNYSGVMLDVFVEAFGGENVQKVIGTAIDDYSAEWTREEWETLPVMLVTQVEGERISFAQRGPMRIVYTEFDPTVKAYQDVIAKWVWMIVSIEFE